MKRRIRAGEHHRYRSPDALDVLAECEREGLDWTRRAARLTRRMCEAQAVVIEPDERIAFTRTVERIPPLYRPEQMEGLLAGRTVHELGPINNICADWGMVLGQGLLARRAAAEAARARLAGDREAESFLDAAIESIDAVLELARRYAATARALGRDDLAEVLQRAPAHPAASFHEALQALRLCHAVLWLSGHYHCGLGRLDQYLWPYLEADLAEARLSPAEAQELLEEFFISLNKDSDLYPGIQQGDNGQSLMLGGMRRDGADGVNPLTAMVLEAGRKVALIDPKINLRVTRDTDLALLAKAVELTRLGLGFPQWCNDEVVVPGLVAAGYDLEDARDYSVAACWEFIIPGKGMEVVNIGAVSMPAAADRAIRAGLEAGEAFDRILERAGADLAEQVRGSGRVQPKAAAAAGALVLGADGRLPGARPGPLPRPQVQQLRHPRGRLGQRRGRLGGGAHPGLRPEANRTGPADPSLGCGFPGRGGAADRTARGRAQGGQSR